MLQEDFLKLREKEKTPNGYIQTKCEHFILRLKERYNIDLTEQEYYDIISKCKLSTNSQENPFRGGYSKGPNRTIGYVNIKNTKIWVLYDNELKCYHTAYPPIIETNIEQCIYACFTKETRKIAMFIYEKFQKESKKVSKLKFNSNKEAYLYYESKTLFPALHMTRYKGYELDFFKTCNQIRQIIYFESKFAELSLKKVRKIK